MHHQLRQLRGLQSLPPLVLHRQVLVLPDQPPVPLLMHHLQARDRSIAVRYPQLLEALLRRAVDTEAISQYGATTTGLHLADAAADLVQPRIELEEDSAHRSMAESRALQHPQLRLLGREDLLMPLHRQHPFVRTVLQAEPTHARNGLHRTAPLSRTPLEPTSQEAALLVHLQTRI